MHYSIVEKLLSAKHSLNIYRGCSHGCIYCDSRSKCYQMKHAFEDIEVKQNAPQILENELRRKRKKVMIVTGAMSDPYLHLERELQYTKGCLEVIEKYGFGISILTKSDLILRDLSLLKQIHEQSKCVVQVTLTTSDEKLCKQLEPHVSTTSQRIEILKRCKEAGIPTVVWLGPFLPFINDDMHNVKQLLAQCIAQKVKGIVCFGIGVTMRQGNREYFYKQLDVLFPKMKEQYQRHFRNQYICGSRNHYAIMNEIKRVCKAHHIMYDVNRIFEYINQYETKQIQEQLSFF